MKDGDSTLKIKTSGLVVLQGILLKLILSGFYVKILGQIFMIVLMGMESLPENRWRRRFVFLLESHAL